MIFYTFPIQILNALMMSVFMRAKMIRKLKNATARKGGTALNVKVRNFQLSKNSPNETTLPLEIVQTKK